MPWWIPATVAGSQLLGTALRSIDFGGPDIDAERVRSTYSNPFASAPAQAAQGSAGRIIGAAGPVDSVMARQQDMRQQQQRYLEGLRGVAMGERSLVEEQMRREQNRLQSAIAGEGASARGDYGALAARRAAPMQSSLIGARLVAPRQAMMQDERDRAMAAYAQALGTQGQQDDAWFAQETARQRAERQGLLGAEETKQYGVGQGNTAKKQTQGYTLADEQYG